MLRLATANMCSCIHLYVCKIYVYVALSGSSCSTSPRLAVCCYRAPRFWPTLVFRVTGVLVWLVVIVAMKSKAASQMGVGTWLRLSRSMAMAPTR